jgi:hypothetical protein
MNHGEDLRGASEAQAQPSSARFGRIFSKASGNERWPDPAALGAANGPMAQQGHGGIPGPPGSLGDLDNPAIPAAFTYLGQFIDHDITLDTTSSLEVQNDPLAIRNFRTASLELDNVYGAGPSVNPHLYDRDRPGRMLLGAVRGASDPPKASEFFDLPRNSQGTALIGDPRNDENLIVAQLHLSFLRFHNAIIDDIELGLGKDVPFEETPFVRAQRLVRWHYQWIVLKHFLPATVGDGVVEDILARGRKLYDPDNKASEAFIPVEFSAAAYRFGHSQVQPGYAVNGSFGAALFPRVINAPLIPRSDLRGGPVSERELVDWSFFIDTGTLAPSGTRHSSLINEKIVSPLLNLPLSVIPDPSLPDGAPMRSLAVRNLQRARMFNLPSGEEAAKEAVAKGVSLEVIDKARIWKDAASFVTHDVPLWFYILREANLLAEGRHLGPLGGRIVAEVLVGLLQKDDQSFLKKKPDWKPLFGKTPGDFTLVDLLHKAQMRGALPPVRGSNEVNMALDDDIFAICNRLSPRGLRERLLGASGSSLDIAQPDAAALRKALLEPIPRVQRGVRGFEDFSTSGDRGVTPGFPARSLLFHALFSPGVELEEYPTPEELEAVENFVYGVTPPSFAELVKRAGGDLAVVVFASEYRPAKDTPFKTHADMAFSRTGVARIGTRQARWDGKNRGYQAEVQADPFAFHVCPARYSAYLAVRKQGTAPLMRPQQGDDGRSFWVPMHKLFPGTECLQGLSLGVAFSASHLNDKIRRTRALSLEIPDVPTTAPFRITSGIAEVDQRGLVTPTPHARLIEPAIHEGKLVTYRVPAAQRTFAAFEPPASTEAGMEVRSAPAYVHARTKVVLGVPEDLNEIEPDINEAVSQGGYDALHYVDMTGEGFVKATVSGLDGQQGFSAEVWPAYSLVSAPDFYPSAGQRELFESTPSAAWGVPPVPLCDTRLPANLQLPSTPFQANDSTVTAVVGLLGSQIEQAPLPRSTDALRHSSLPDDCAGVFAPGWDVATDKTSGGEHHLAAYGLGSPFPEDAKLCAALSTFWPAVAPDASRGMSANPNPRLRGTVAPLTDEEVGQIGTLPWDGVSGPKVVSFNGEEFVECASFLHVDYVRSALEGRFTLRLTSQVGEGEFRARMTALRLAHRATGRGRNSTFVLSFRAILTGDPELQRAQLDTSTVLQGPVFRVETVLGGDSVEQPHPSDHRKKLLKIRRREAFMVAPSTGNLLRKRHSQQVWVRVP